MRERVRPGAAVLALAVVLSGGACSRTNPAFLGSQDGGPPVLDGATGGDGGGGADDSGAPVADAAPADGPCVPGAACQPPGEPCSVGTLACEAAGPVCGALQNTPNGVGCGAGKICKDGSCTPCPAGDACAIPGADECVGGTITCLDPAHLYTPFCANPHPAPNGTPCAAGVCNGGVCKTSCSAATPDCLSGEVCDLAGCGATVLGACVAPPATCPDLFSPVCGCDRNTYNNDCERLRAGVALDHPGPCTTVFEADCMDGIDNDGNGLTDCEDPACAGYACVDAPPAGWEAVPWVDPNDQLDCDGLTPFELYDPADIVPADIGCGCQCGTPSAGCVATLECYPAQTCDDPTSRTATAVGASCHAVPSPSVTGACRATGLEARGGCGPIPSTSKPTPSYTWAPTARACATNVFGYCAGGAGTPAPRCVPRPPAGAVGPCIAGSGQTPCPAPYTVGATYATGHATDNRTCTGCTCGPLQGGVCQCGIASGSQCGIAVGASNTCDLLATLFLPVSPATCVPSVTGIISAYAKLVGVELTSTGSCQPTALGSPTGEIVPAGAITLCCVP
ncbi:MAG TPA: hypothetical protein VGQ83_03830 [Polyangia bacterium]|jgi:hypothetical protein